MSTTGPPPPSNLELVSSRSASPAWGELALVAVICAALALAVEYPYRTSGFVSDDQMHLERIGELVNGRIGWGDYLLRSHNVHVLPAWKLWYYAQWRAFGVAPGPWHVAIAVVHALGAVALYVCLCAALGDGFSAIVGALLWAGCAMGKPDNPLNWIAASHLTFGVTPLLCAAACVTYFHAPRSRLWAVACGAWATVSILCMASMFALLPTLPAIYWWGERRRDDPRPLQVFWLVCWLPAPILAAALQWSSYARGGYVVPIEEDIDVAAGTLAALLHFPLALANLLGWSHPAMPSDEIAVKALLALAALGLGLWWCRTALLKLYLLVFAATALMCWLGNVKGSYNPLEKLLASGRFTYLPTLAWCVLLAGLLATVLAHASPAMRRRIGGAALIALVCFVGLQTRAALVSRERFEMSARLVEFRQQEEGWREVLLMLAREGRSSGRPVQLPNEQVQFPMLKYRISTLVTVLNPDLAPYVSAQTPDAVGEEARRRVLRILGGPWKAHPQAAALRVILRQGVKKKTQGS